MIRTVAVLIALTLAASALAPAMAGRPPEPSRIPVLVELFTSEGCSSCPPADRVLTTLIERQPVAGIEIIGLGEHVDYWNHLGWSDPYSGAAFTARQREYAHALGVGTLYTPQLVVDGGSALVGSDLGRAEEAIARAGRDPRDTVTVRVSERARGHVTLEIRAAALAMGRGRGEADLVLAVTENHLASSVTAGENQGRRLTHAAVVRRMKLLGHVGARGFVTRCQVSIEPSWKPADLRAVAFVQDPSSRHILAAASVLVE